MTCRAAKEIEFAFNENQDRYLTRDEVMMMDIVANAPRSVPQTKRIGSSCAESRVERANEYAGSTMYAKRR